MRRIYLHYIIIIFLLSSCGGMSDAGKVLRNEKNNTTDEFLVKKREPLTLPPDYKTLPEPESLEDSNAQKDKKIDSIIKITKKKTTSKSKLSIEQSIINEIRK